MVNRSAVASRQSKIRNRGMFLMLAVAPAAALFTAHVTHAAVNTWSGAGTTNTWLDAGNWGGVAPAGDGTAQLVFTGANTSNNNNFTANTVFNGLTFDANAIASFTLSGNAITLGPTTDNAGSTGGSIINSSTNSQSVGLAVTLSKGKHLISTTASAGTLNLNGSFTRSVGSTVVFTTAGGAINTTGSGLANTNSILGGWAVIGGNWATLDGSNNVVAYTNYTTATTSIASSAATNVKITASGSATIAAATTDINSLLYFNTGANLTVDVQGKTLRLGALGGIWNTSAGSNRSLVIGLSNSTSGVLTAGGSANSGGEITLLSGGTDGSFTSTNNNLTINAAIKDNGTNSVSLNIQGYVILNHSGDTYTGGTTIAQGRVQAAAVQAFGTGNVTILQGGEAFLNAGSSNWTNNFFLTGTGPTETSGGQNLGAIRFASNATISGTVTLVGNTRISGSSGGTNSITGKITGTGLLEVTSSTGANTALGFNNTNNDWVGDLQLTAAASRAVTVRISASNVIPDASNLILNGSADVATFNLNGFNETINGLYGANATSNAVTGSAASTLTFGAGNAANATFGGIISGAMNIAKTGSGTQTLSGTNTFTGNTTVNSGTLALSAAANNIASSALITVNGGTLDVSNVSGGFALGSTQKLANNASVVGSVSTVTGSLVTGTGTFTGNVSVNGGNINPGTVGTIGTLTAGNLTLNSGTLTFDMTGSSADSITVSGAATFNGGGINLSVLTPLNQTAYTILTAGSIVGTPTLNTTILGRSNFTIDATALLSNIIQIDVSGNPANLTWAGTTNGNWDNLQTDSNWTTSDPVADTTHFYDNDRVTFNDNNAGQYNVNVNSNVIIGNMTVNNTAGTYVFSSTNGSAITGLGGITKSGAGNLTLATNNSYSGGTTLNAGNLNINANNALGTGNLTVNGGTIDNNSGTAVTVANAITLAGSTSVLGTNDLTLSGAISGAGGITKLGTATLTLSGSSSYTGNVNINNGVVVAVNSTSLGNTSFGSSITIDGGTLDLSGNTTSNGLNFGTHSWFLNGTGFGSQGVIVNNSSTVNQQNAVGGNITLLGNTTIGGSRRWDIRNNNPVVNLSNFTLTKIGSNQISIVSAQLNSSGSAVINVNQGELALESATTTNGTGTINFAFGTVLGLFSNTGTISWDMTFAGNNIIGNAGTGATTILSNMVFNGDVTVGPVAGGALTVNSTGNFPLTLAGALSGVGNVTVSGSAGSGLVTFSGANTYAGNTIISGGNLSISSDANLGAGPGSPTAGKIAFTLNGTNSGALIVTADMTLDANRGIAITGTGTLNVAAGKTLTYNGIVADGTGTGNLNFAGGGTVNLGGANAFTGTLTLSGIILKPGVGSLPTSIINFGTGSSTLDMGSQDMSLTLNFADVASTTFNHAIIGTGNLTIANAGDFVMGGGNTTASVVNLDLSTLNVVTYNNATGQFLVGGHSVLATGNLGGQGTLSLGNVTNITAATVGVASANSPSTTAGAQNQGVFHLGNTTTINTTTLNVGGTVKAIATMDFRTGTVNPTLTLRGVTGGSSRADIIAGRNNTGSTAVPTTATLDFTAGTIDALVGNMTLGQWAGTGGGSGATGIFKMGAGNLDATSILLGQDSQGATNAANVINGTFELTTGNVTVGTLTMADDLVAGGAVGNGTFTIHSGTLTAGTIAKGANGGTATLSWESGTIQNATGADLAINGAVTTNLNTAGTHTFNVSGTQTATLSATSVVAGNGSLSKAGTGTLVLGAANTYVGGTNVNAGTLTVGGSLASTGALTNNATVNFNNASQTIASLNGTTSAATVNLNTTALTVSGGGSYKGSVKDSGTAGTLTVANGSSLTTGSVQVGTVNVGTSSGATLAIASGSTGSKVSTLTIAGAPATAGGWTGKVDLNNNALAVQGTDATDRNNKLATVIDQVKSGRNGGNWLGNGITSSTAAALPTGFGSKAVGVFLNSDFPTPLTTLGAGGPSVDLNTVIVATTFNGDANLDGKVDLVDLTAIANHWQTSQNNWAVGDITLDGFVDINDLTAVANNWQAGVGPGFSGMSFAAAMAEVTFGGSVGAVPEPASLGVLGLGGLMLLKRKRR